MAFLDECGFLTQPLRKRTWGRRGQRTVVRVPGSRQKLSVLAALIRRPNGIWTERFTMQAANFKTMDCFWFVLALWKASDRRLTVVWDNLSAHRKAAELFQEIGVPGLKFEWLPKYAPDLNPVECLWSSVKWGALGNFAPTSREQLRERVATELRSRARRRRFLRSLVRQTGLSP